MKPSEIAIKFEQFKSEISSLKGDDLLDKWIEFQDSPAKKEPDLGVLKSGMLERAMQEIIGIDYWKKVEARKIAKIDQLAPSTKGEGA